MATDFLNLLENTDLQTVNVSYNRYPESFFSAKFEIDAALKKYLTIGMTTETEVDIGAPGGEREIKKLSMELSEGEESIEITLTKETTRGLLLILNQIYKNLGE